MKNHVFSSAIKVAITSFVLITASVKVCDVHAHDDHGQSFGNLSDVYLTGYHSHDLNGKLHRHAISRTHPEGAVHDTLDLWNKHEHEGPEKDFGTYPLTLHSVSGDVHTHDGRSHKHVVIYARLSDGDIASDILQKLNSQEIDHNVESDVYTLQYIGQHVDGVSSIEHTHEWEHKHGNFEWHTHKVKHSHVFKAANHPIWFENNEADDNYPVGTFFDGHEELHPPDEDYSTASVPSNYRTVASLWASLKAR